MGNTDESYMRRALRLAERGLGLTSPNPPVGAIIVSAGGKVIGRGFHHRAGEAHAEVAAIRNALKKHSSRSLRNSTIFVTLEPCSTEGKTPACTDAILEYGFRRVVYACSDPNPKHRNQAKRILSRRGIDVSSGVLKEECSEVIRFFTRHQQTGLPWVIAKSAMTLDGRTTLPRGQGPWITGKESLADVHRLRSQVDAILIGGETLRKDNPQLTVRGAPAKRRHEQPWRIIVSQGGKLPEKSKVFSDRHRERTRVFTGKSLRQVLKQLGREGILSVMMESGGRLLGDALKKDLVDEVVFYYAPIIGGGGNHAVQLKGLAKKLVTMETKKFGLDLRVRGLIKRS